MPPRKRKAPPAQASATNAKAPSPADEHSANEHDDDDEYCDRLALCARSGDVDNVKSLLAVVKAKHIALFMACECGKKAACSAIIQASADAGANLEATTPDGETPLMRAVKKRKPAAVKALLDAGADPERTDDRGQTALDYAKQKSGPEAEIIRLIGTSATKAKKPKV